jgi:hypothetical protein
MPPHKRSSAFELLILTTIHFASTLSYIAIMSSQATVSATSAAIITGGAGGIVERVARQMAAKGQFVVVFDMSLAGAEQIV